MIDFDSRANNWDSDPKKSERANAVAVAIRKIVPLSTTMTALEYGCGTGLLSFTLQPFLGRIILADNSLGTLAVLKEKLNSSGIKNMTPLQLDLSTGSLLNEKCDLIYMLMVLHHIPDTTAILRAFHAMLLTPGYVCIADLDKEDGSFHGVGFEVHKGFGRDMLGNNMLEVGFNKVRFSTCFEMVKNGRRYPLFLAVAERNI